MPAWRRKNNKQSADSLKRVFLLAFNCFRRLFSSLSVPVYSSYLYLMKKHQLFSFSAFLSGSHCFHRIRSQFPQGDIPTDPVKTFRATRHLQLGFRRRSRTFLLSIRIAQSYQPSYSISTELPE